MRLLTPIVLTILILMGCRVRESGSDAKDYPGQIAVSSTVTTDKVTGFFNDGVADGADGRLTKQTSKSLKSCKLTRGNKVDIVQEKFPAILEGSVDLNHITFSLTVEGITQESPKHNAKSASAVFFDAKNFTELMAGEKVLFHKKLETKKHKTRLDTEWNLDGKRLTILLSGIEPGYYKARTMMNVEFVNEVKTFDDLMYGPVKGVEVVNFVQNAGNLFGWKAEEEVSKVSCSDFVN